MDTRVPSSRDRLIKGAILVLCLTRDIGGFPEDLLKECGKGGAFDMILAFSDAVEKIKEDY